MGVENVIFDTISHSVTCLNYVLFRNHILIWQLNFGTDFVLKQYKCVVSRLKFPNFNFEIFVQNGKCFRKRLQ